MRPTDFFAPLALSALLCPLTAQGSLIVPAGAATADGASADQEPFGYDQARHVQYVHANLVAGMPLNTLVKELQYRRDGAAPNPTFTRARGTTKVKPVWQIRLGNVLGTVNVMQPPSEFPGVADPNWTVVFTPKQVDFPDLNLVGGGGPQNFDIKFLFDVPWQWKGPTLGIEHYVAETNNAAYVYIADAAAAPPSSGSADLITPQSLGCPKNQNRAYGASASPGQGDLVFTLFGAPATAGAFACLGASSTQWGSLPLPFDLTASLALPGCFVYCDLVVAIPRPTNGSGSSELRAPIPADAGLAGGTVFGQWVVQDSRVNPAVNLATSDGLKFTLGGGLGPQTSVVSAIANLAGGRSGFVQPGRGLVFTLVW